jgi:hypothetical protein
MDAEQLREQVAGMRFAADLRAQFEALGSSADARIRRLRRRRIVLAVVIGVAIAVILGSVALAGGFNPLSLAGTNARGQTYGTLPDGPSDPIPDLVRTMATNGRTGYCREKDMLGPCPRDAEANTKACLRGYAIPVYESDGTTQIGEFIVGGPGSEAVYEQADGTVTMEADADGNITTTTSHADGTVTIATETLDGTVTTKTLTAAEAKRLKQETTELAPGPTWSAKPVRPPAWLPEQLSQTARDAGDAYATAFWEPQNRCYLKRIEGRDAPRSPHEQEALVWFIVLHGDFRTCTWMYQVLDYHSHHLLSQGTSDEPFDTSELPPLHGPIKLGGE